MESTAAAILEHPTATKVEQASGIEQMLQELSDSINAYVQAQKEENQRFWTYLMHLKAQKHQFSRYMQNKYEDFLESLPQQFNFQRVETLEVLSITYLLKKLKVSSLQVSVLRCDNKSIEALANNPKYTLRLNTLISISLEKI